MTVLSVLQHVPEKLFGILLPKVVNRQSHHQRLIFPKNNNLHVN